MSPPDVNVEKQKRRERPVFVVFAIGFVVAAILAAIYFAYLDEADPPITEPEVAEPAAEGGTGG